MNENNWHRILFTLRKFHADINFFFSLCYLLAFNVEIINSNNNIAHVLLNNIIKNSYVS